MFSEPSTMVPDLISRVHLFTALLFPIRIRYAYFSTGALNAAIMNISKIDEPKVIILAM
jgi:hypothetical protein